LCARAHGQEQQSEYDERDMVIKLAFSRHGTPTGSDGIA
jgi:hypothetical protein